MSETLDEDERTSTHGRASGLPPRRMARGTVPPFALDCEDVDGNPARPRR